MIRQVKHIFFLIVFLVFTQITNSQILSSYSDYRIKADYVIDNGPDTLYFFNKENDSTFLYYDSIDYSTYSYSWEEYIPGTGYQSLTGGNAKIWITPTIEGETYRLTLISPIDTIISHCWVFLNDYTIQIISKTAEDNLEPTAYINCYVYSPIRIELQNNTYQYFNPDTISKIYTYKLPINSRLWESNIILPDGEGLMEYQGFAEPVYYYSYINPYWEDHWYTFVTKDVSGLERRDSLFIVTYMPHAEGMAEFIRLDNQDFYPESYGNYYDDNYYSYDTVQSAPALFRFKNSGSVKASRYKWVFGDSDSVTVSEDTVYHQYEFWGEYQPVLIAERQRTSNNFLNCFDTLKLDKILITEPRLNAPNVFTPPNGKIPVWRFYDASISYFEISIYNRYGKRVHHFVGNIRDWEGWNGKINNTDNIASTGVYYYLVRNFGPVRNNDPKISIEEIWTGNQSDDTGGQSSGKNSNNEYRGFIHLFSTE